MTQINDTDYLLRPAIEGTVFIIEDSHVRITSPSTIHAEAKPVTILNKSGLIALYKNVLSKAKSKSVRISYASHIRRQITERWEEYENRCNAASVLFSQIIEQAKTVRERGLHYGTRDDGELEKLQKLCFEHNNFFNRNTVISQMSEIFYSLKSTDEDLSSSNHQYDMIYL